MTTRIPDARARTSRGKRVWEQFLHRRQPRHFAESNEYVRQGGAAAREMLIQAAATQWKVPAAECSAANSVVTHNPSGRKLSYGKLADAAAKLDAAQGHQAQGPEGLEDRRQAGQLRRIDTPDKVQGKTVYGIDIKLLSAC